MFIVEFLLKRNFNSKHQKGTSLCDVRENTVNQRKRLKKICNELRRCPHYIKTVNVGSLLPFPLEDPTFLLVTWSAKRRELLVNDISRRVALGMRMGWRRLQSAFQFLRMTRTEKMLPVCCRRGSRRSWCLRLFCRWRQRNVQTNNSHAQPLLVIVLLIKIFCLVTFSLP